ncbi:MAG: penicillin-binding protein 2 [Spartobacteria bacterium]|nr:penicillin-binding protein 2 [Spartobacteria bacterium]
MIDRGYIWRTTLVVVALLAVWAGLAVRLGYLHLGPNETLRERVRQMRSVEQEILVGRGRILDRNGQLLALDLPVKNIIVEPKVVLSNGQARAVSAQLARVLELPYEQVFARVNKPGDPYEPVARLVREEVAEKVMRLQLKGVYPEPLTTRYYPHDSLGCHLLGFSNAEGVGSAGLEQRWDALLKGRPGLRQSERDGVRREMVLRRTLQIEPQEGADVHLTLDLNVQYFVEKALDAAMTNLQAEAAWAIVQDVRTGAILAMASRPAYDLNAYAKTAPETRLNRAVGVNFEPGSIFKIGVVAAALNEGLVATNDVFDCENGMWFYAGRPLKDFHPYGDLDVTGILRKSSNIGAAKIAVLLGEERLHRYLSAYGLGRLTGIEVPGEETGILNPWRKWAKIDVTRVAMGHSVAVTALQMLNVLCCIGNDGFLMKSHVVRKVVDVDGVVLQENKPEALARPITERTAALMRRMLAEVTGADGTGKRAAVAGYTVAGKTGSAEKIVAGRYVKNANVSSFMGMLPAERPEIGIIVVLDNPTDPATGLRTGGITAAPVFAQIAEPVARYLDVRPLDAAEMVYYRKILDGAP